MQNETAEEVILMRREQKEKEREQQTAGFRGARSFEGHLMNAHVSSAAKAFSRSLSRRERSVVRETETPEDGQQTGSVELPKSNSIQNEALPATVTCVESDIGDSGIVNVCFVPHKFRTH